MIKSLILELSFIFGIMLLISFVLNIVVYTYYPMIDIIKVSKSAKLETIQYLHRNYNMQVVSPPLQEEIDLNKLFVLANIYYLKEIRWFIPPSLIVAYPKAYLFSRYQLGWEFLVKDLKLQESIKLHMETHNLEVSLNSITSFLNYYLEKRNS